MSPRRTLFTAWRVLEQLRHDPRTIVLILLVPSILITVLKYVFNGDSAQFNSFAPLLLGVFPFIIMLVVASVTTLRERTAGTLERLLTLPLSKLDFISGYALAFSLLALCQGVLAAIVALDLLGVTIQGGALELLCVVLLSGLVGTALGLLLSAFATSEFQVVQFMPAFVFPQLLTCGLFVPREHMARLLRWFADIMPLTYIIDATKKAATTPGWSHDLRQDIGIIGAYAIGALILGALSLRRQR